MFHLLLLIGYTRPHTQRYKVIHKRNNNIPCLHVIHTRNQIFSHRPSPSPYLQLTP